MTRTKVCRTCKGAGETDGEACLPCFGAGLLEVWTFPERKEAEGVEQLGFEGIEQAGTTQHRAHP